MEDAPVTLRDVVITHELLSRPAPRAADLAEKEALAAIATATAAGPDAILRALCQTGLRVCRAGSCGVNVLEGESEAAQFRWLVIEGELAPYQNGTAPADHSPCGYVKERNSAQLLRDAARYFTWMEGVIQVREALIVPLHRDKGEMFGTMWVVSHDEERCFNKEDLRLLTLLSSHAASALKLFAAAYRTGA